MGNKVLLKLCIVATLLDEMVQARPLAKNVGG